MLSAGWLVLAVVLAVLLSMWVTFTLTRLDRLHARVDAAWAALDAQLVRRAAALQHAAQSPDSGVAPEQRGPCDRAALAALAAQGEHDRQETENAVGRTIAGLADTAPDLPLIMQEELREGGVRVQVARRFYNDAVRDTRSLRARRMPRLLRLAGRRELPQYFDIEDSVAFPSTPIKEGT